MFIVVGTLAPPVAARPRRPPGGTFPARPESSGEDHARAVAIKYETYLYFVIMDLGDPTKAVTPTLDGPVLAALATAGRPLTVGEIAQQAARGSEIGIRRCVQRLVRQGIVRATAMGRNTVHELNREHVAADVALRLADLRLELWRRLRAELSGWNPAPSYACVFGSAARGDGDESSDIDLLLVQPMPTSTTTPTSSASGDAIVGLAVATAFALSGLAKQAFAAPIPPGPVWDSQVERLRHKVWDWTGNQAQILDLPLQQWLGLSRSNPALHAEVQAHAIVLRSLVAVPGGSAKGVRGNPRASR